MCLQTEVDKAVKLFVKMKRTMCEESGGPHDLAPMLHFKYKHLKECCGALLMGGHPNEMIAPAWRKILDHGIPEFVILMVEGYASEGMPENYERGNMERDFKENPESKVREVITLQAVDIKTGGQMTAVVSYHYGDDGLPVFADPVVGPCEGEAMNYNMAAIFKACREATITFLQDAA